MVALISLIFDLRLSLAVFDFDFVSLITSYRTFLFNIVEYGAIYIHGT